jgi:trigger factor
MEVTVNHKKESSEVELTVTVPSEDFKPFVERALGTLGKNLELKGFRKGKAPANLVMESMGQDRVLHEAMDLALPHFFAEAAVDHAIEVVSRPAISVQEIGMDVPFRFIATVQVVPEITLAEPSTLTVTKKDITVTDEQIQQELNHLARSRSTFTDVDRPAQPSDVVTIDFTVRIDGNVIEGGESKNHPVTIGEGRFVPGFEDGLIGMKKGEDKTFPISFPEDYAKKELQGKQAEASAHVHAVQERKLPALDDVFAKTLGKFETIAALTEQLKKNMLEEFTAREDERYAGELAEQLTEKSTFGVIPSSLIEHEIDRRMEEFANMLAYQQKTIDQYIVEHETTLASMRENMKESAEKQVRVGLALRALAKKHDLTVSEEEITTEANAQLSRFASIKEASDEIDPDQLREYVASTLKNKKTIELLVSLAPKK